MILCSLLVLELLPENSYNILLIPVFPVPRKTPDNLLLYTSYTFLFYSKAYMIKKIYIHATICGTKSWAVRILYLLLCPQNPAEFHILRRCSANFSWIKSNWISENKPSIESSSLSERMNDTWWYYWRKIYWRKEIDWAEGKQGL